QSGRRPSACSRRRAECAAADTSRSHELARYPDDEAARSDDVMHRRRFLVGLTSSILALPLPVDAQQAGRVYRLAVFHVGPDHVPPSLDGLREGLRTLGYDTGT